MRVQIELNELGVLQIDDMCRRTGLTVECIYRELLNALTKSANSRLYLCEAIQHAHHEKIVRDEEIKRLKQQLNLFTNGNKNNRRKNYKHAD